ncbi:hypothetical protein COBT_000135 [Conglomerata obtusa]
MGVKHLWKLINSAAENKTPTNQTLAIDTSIWLHHYKQTTQTIFITQTCRRILKLLLHKNRPIFVFDTGVPLLKKKVVMERQRLNVQDLARRYIRNEECKVCGVMLRECMHAAVEKSDVLYERDEKVKRRIVDERPYEWGFDESSDDLCDYSSELHDGFNILNDFVNNSTNFINVDSKGYEKSYNAINDKNIKCTKTYNTNTFEQMFNNSFPKENLIGNNKIINQSLNTEGTSESSKNKNFNNTDRKKYFNDEIEILEKEEFSKLSKNKQLKTLVGLRELRKMPVKSTTQDGLEFSLEQLNNVRKRNKISAMIKKIGGDEKRILSDCKNIYTFTENKATRQTDIKDESSDNSIFGSDENSTNKKTELLKYDNNKEINNKNKGYDFFSSETEENDEIKKIIEQEFLSSDNNNEKHIGFKKNHLFFDKDAKYMKNDFNLKKTSNHNYQNEIDENNYEDKDNKMLTKEKLHESVSNTKDTLEVNEKKEYNMTKKQKSNDEINDSYKYINGSNICEKRYKIPIDNNMPIKNLESKVDTVHVDIHKNIGCKNEQYSNSINNEENHEKYYRVESQNNNNIESKNHNSLDTNKSDQFENDNKTHTNKSNDITENKYGNTKIHINNCNNYDNTKINIFNLRMEEHKKEYEKSGSDIHYNNEKIKIINNDMNNSENSLHMMNENNDKNNIFENNGNIKNENTILGNLNNNEINQSDLTSINNTSKDGNKFIKETNNENIIINEKNKNCFLYDDNSINENFSGEINILSSKIKEILIAFDLIYIDAPLEADSQCAYLSLSNIVDGIITEDNDVFLYGCQRVYKNYYKRNKHIEMYDMKKIEEIVTRDEMILMSFLLGSDYTIGVKGVGLKNSFIKVKNNEIKKEDCKYLFDLYYGSMYKEIEPKFKKINKKKINNFLIKNGIENKETEEINFYVDKIIEIQNKNNKFYVD